MNIINGKIIEQSIELDSLKDFVKRWSMKIMDIRKLSLDNKQAFYIAENYLSEATISFGTKKELDANTKITILNQLANDLYLALDTAYSSYRRENPSFWRLFLKELKLPPITFKF